MNVPIKLFWNSERPFVSIKDAISNENTIIKTQREKNEGNRFRKWTHIEANELIKDDKVLVALLNDHYIDMVEKTSRLAPNCIGNPENPNLDKSTVLDIILNFQKPLRKISIKLLGN